MPSLVITGSFSAIGHHPTRPADETVPVDPFSRLLPYQLSKVAMEHACLKAVADGLTTPQEIERVLGPRESGGAVNRSQEAHA